MPQPWPIAAQTTRVEPPTMFGTNITVSPTIPQQPATTANLPPRPRKAAPKPSCSCGERLTPGSRGWPSRASCQLSNNPPNTRYHPATHQPGGAATASELPGTSATAVTVDSSSPAAWPQIPPANQPSGGANTPTSRQTSPAASTTDTSGDINRLTSTADGETR